MSESKSSPTLMITNNRLYDTLKYLTQIGLPALGTLYFALSQIWGLPAGEEVVGTIVALTAFLGVLLGVNSAAYNHSSAKYDGAIDITEEDGVKRFSLELAGDPEELDQHKEILFKVNKLDTPYDIPVE